MRFLILSFILLAFSVTLTAQSLGYNNMRIAISADGNNQADDHPEAQWPRADPDDWGGTPAALAMLAKQDLQDQLVHYSYNNFIEAPPHTTERNYMAEAVNGAIQRWDFDETLFFDVPENDSLAITHLADQIKISTASDPLYFIHMGPSEFFYRAVKQVLDSGITDALSHVQVISHSGYNDNHLRRYAHHTMAEAIALSGDRIKYQKIADQNACDNPDQLWCSGTDFTPFRWMEEHNDPNIQWLWSRLQFHPGGKGADISDAGMVFYLTTGDEYGNLAKFEQFIGTGIPGGSVIPAECTDLTYVGIQDFEMQQIDSFVISYKDIGRNAVAVDASIYKDKFGATQKIFDGVNGFYNISLTSLTEIDGESSYRLRINNSLIGEFQNPASTTDYTEYVHTFENILVENGDVIQIESNTHSNGTVPEGDAFAFSRGRWRSIDFECTAECRVGEKDGLLVFEAERFELKGQWKLGYDADKASGGAYIYFNGPNSYTSVNQSDVISYTFKINNPGNYTVKWTMRQPEGERGTDKGNDAWIYFSDDRGYAGSVKLEHYEKFYGRSDDNFTLNGTAEVHDLGHKWLTAKFPSAGEYTLNIGGRSHGLQIDRVVLYKEISINEAEQKIGEISETSNCGSILPVDPPQVYASPKSMVMPYLDTSLIIDGVEEESWFFFAPNFGSFESQGNALPGKTDLSYSFKAAYDSASLYFLIHVLDDLKRAHSGTGTDYWNADNVELFFNPDNGHELVGAFGDDAIQIRLNYGNDSSLYSGKGSWKGEAGYAGFQYAYKDNDSGYVIEAKIPWEGISDNMELQENLEMGFDIAVTDMDEGDAPEHIITWANDTEAGDESRDTRKFGTIKSGFWGYPYLDPTNWTILCADSILVIDFRAIYEISHIHFLSWQEEWGLNGATGPYEVYISKSKDIWGKAVHRSGFYFGDDPEKLDSVVSGRYLKIVSLSESQDNRDIQPDCRADIRLLGKYISQARNLDDTISPVIYNLPGDIYLETGPDACTATVYWSSPRARDNYEGATISVDYEPGYLFEIGSTKVTYTAMDAAGNATLGTFNIHVSDKEPPVFTSYPENIVDSLEPGDSLIQVSWNIPEASDLCSDVSLSSTHESGDLFGPGTTEVLYSAEDEYGNTESIRFYVQIESPLDAPDHLASPEILVYPVPAKNILFVSLPKAKKALIRLFSATGKALKQMESNGGTQEIDISGLSAGIYMLGIEFDNYAHHSKVIVR